MIHRDDITQASFELAKWAAVIAMIADHYGKIVDPALYVPTHMVGRIAFPLFAWIIACRLAIRPDLAAIYIRRLIPWALISQPVFYYAGREWYEPNILFELLAGVIVVRAIVAFSTSWRSGLVVVAFGGLGWFFDYGPAGVLSIAVMYFAMQKSVLVGLIALGATGALVNLPLTDAQSVAFVGAGAAASAIALVSLHAPPKLIPRLPPLFFYAFYPLHLLLLIGYAGLE